MDQTPRFTSLGRQFKRTFIAFILSYYIVFLQVWLGIELFKLAQELERARNYYGIEEFRKSSKLFLGARAAAFAAFILGLVAFVASFVNPYGYYGYSYGYYELISMISIIRVIPTIIELALLLAAWKNLYYFFEHDNSPSTQSRLLGLKSTGRVRWALGVTIAATVIQVFLSNLSSYDYYDYFGYYGYSYLMPMILSLLGGFLMLLGSINAGVGWYDTSRAFRNYQEPYEKRPRPVRLPDRELRIQSPRDAYKELPFHPDNLAPKKVSTEQYVDAPVSEEYYSEIPVKQDKMKYCYNCGTLLPEVAGLRFCPNCGIRVS